MSVIRDLFRRLAVIGRAVEKSHDRPLGVFELVVRKRAAHEEGVPVPEILIFGSGNDEFVFHPANRLAKTAFECFREIILYRLICLAVVVYKLGIYSSLGLAAFFFRVIGIKVHFIIFHKISFQGDD